MRNGSIEREVHRWYAMCPERRNGPEGYFWLPPGDATDYALGKGFIERTRRVRKDDFNLRSYRFTRYGCVYFSLMEK